MRTGGFTKEDEAERQWNLWERSCMKLDGYRAGNEGLTVVELLLKAKEIAVTTETLGDAPYYISSKDEWGKTEAWIESDGKTGCSNGSLAKSEETNSLGRGMANITTPPTMSLRQSELPEFNTERSMVYQLPYVELLSVPEHPMVFKKSTSRWRLKEQVSF